MSDRIPHVTLDWDYDTFHWDDEGNLWLYDVPDGVDLVVVDGHPAPGQVLPQTYARRVPGHCAFKLGERAQAPLRG